MNRLLERKYYENDEAFYVHKANVSCWEQMQYQSLRDYDVDYFLVFCDDISIEYSSMKGSLSTHNLNLNSEIFIYHCVTNNHLEAEGAIDGILQMGKIVIFQTALDYLHTCSWYHDNEPFTRTSHNAIIIGRNDESFFYVDSPPMRNEKFFFPHPDNLAVGCINRKELLDAFSYFCEIGYIEIDEKKLNSIADINTILRNIKEKFNCKSNGLVCVGREALLNFAKDLEEGSYKVKELLSDSFPINLIVSRHKKLKICIGKYFESFTYEKYRELEAMLNILIEKWSVCERIIIKYSISRDAKCLTKVSNIIKNQIIPLTEDFIDRI